MANNEHPELSEKLVCDHLCHVTGKNAAWVFVQEPGFVGFGVVRKDKICWPPLPDKDNPQDWEPDWDRIRDLRLFGEKGEWHVWPYWNGGWKSRLLKLENIDEALTEYHVLWGTWPPERGQHPWVKLVETRGTEIWLPIADSQLGEKDFPLRFKLKQVIGYDDKSIDSSHLAGIIDAALVALVNSCCEKVLDPPLLSCSESSKVAEETNCSSGDLPDTQS